MHFTSFDGVRIAYRTLGEGRPVLLIHGLFSTGMVNWIKYGTAKRLTDAGYRLILPDLRGHGESACPQGAEHWPHDVLARDMEALMAHLALDPAETVVGGYSLGARTTVRMLARGMRPRASILAGMGLDGIVHASGRGGWYIRLIEGRGTWKRGDPYFMAEAFMKANVPNPEPLVHLLRNQADTPLDVLESFDFPILVICGKDDDDNGSAPDLAAALPDARYREIPGTHMLSVTRPDLGEGIERFLAELPD